MWRNLAREPLVHFLLAGLAFFALAQWHSRANDPYRIVVGEAQLSQLRHAYEAEFGSPPAPAVMPKLIEDYVASEVLFREGLARGLDRDDQIVRRRVIQKVQFLEEGRGLPQEPSEADLRKWYGENRERYAEPKTIGFAHLFFAADASNEAAVRARALAVLPRLSPTVAPVPEWGDSFPDRSVFDQFSPADASRLFGDTEIASELFRAPVGVWRGPWRSPYGWHLVRVSGEAPGRVKSFEEVRDAVTRDYRDAARATATAKRMAELRARYTVVRE